MAHPLRIQRKRTKGYRLPAGAVCVHRPTKWGNPFVIVDDGHCKRTMTIDGKPVEVVYPGSAVDSYESWLYETIEGGGILCLAIMLLRGKKLACFCPLDKRCHADVLAEAVNREVK